MKASIHFRYFPQQFLIRIRPLVHTVAMAIAIYSGSALAQTVNFPTVPLTVATAVPSNLLYIHDDSNSMYQSFMPDEIGRSSKVSAVPYQFFMSHQFNKLYYNPAVKYVPPPAPPGTTPVDADGRSVTDGTLGNAKYTDAWFNGYDLVGRNQSGYYASDLQLTISGCSKATVANATNTAYRRFNLDTSFTPTNDWSGAYSTNYSSFYPISGQCPLLGGAWKFSEFLGGAPTGRASYYVCPPDVWKNYPAHTASAVDYDHWLCQQKYLTNDEEKQNFANWYAYYRTRNYASKAGIGRAFEKLDPGVRVGWGLINKISFSSMDGKSVDTVMQGVRKFDQTRKKIFFDWLYKIQPANMKNPYLVNQLPADERDEKGGTPLRKALDSAGRYYDRSDGSSLGPWADDPAKPGTAATEKAAACRKSFTILMTDGYWNGSSAPTPGISGVNVDGSAPAPFKDSYANTLADVAWYYWKKDLLPSVASKVPKSPVPGLPGKYRDDATHQHMTTFTIGLGVAGTIDKNKAFRAIYDPSVGTITWRDPGVNADPDTLDPAFTTAKIDDLLHAAVNGHGDFFSAGNPDEFVTGMSAIIDTINSEQQIASGNIDAMEGTAQGSFILKTYYKPGDWRGELIAQKITNLAGLDLENERWLASEEMPAPAVRRIYTRNSQKKGVPFMWGNLQDTTLQNALKGPGQLLDGQKVLDYIRGSSANEGQNSGQFRPRYRGAPGVAPLGDSPHNTPLLVQYGGGGTVFLGANDGMLHAFDVNTGKEQFAYIPSALISKLAELTNGHAFYVDGEIRVTTPAQTPGQYLLVGALGRGGKGLYGLDVSNPAGFYENNVKWEINGSRTCPDPDPDTNYLGNVVGSLVYAEVKGKPSVVFGNGYNSCSDKAALAIVNAIDGSVAFIKASDESKNGLAAPGIGEDPTDHAVSAYAGDLLGKMWKFGMIPLLGTPQKILDPGVAPQPITAQPATMVIEPTPGTKRTFVFFGTGSYLGVADRGTTAPQYLYGLADNSGATVSRSDLKPLTFTTAENNGLRVKTATPQSGAATDSKKGWYIQMTDAGERVVSAPIFYRDSVIFTSIVPSNKNDPCDDSKGSGYLYMINPKTGETVERLFILDGAEVPDVASNSNIGEVLGGMPGQARIIEGRIVICGQDVAKCISLGEPHSPPDNPSKGRISWREIITH